MLSILVTQYALGLFQEMMKEEGYDAAQAAQKDDDADAPIDVLASVDGSAPAAPGQATPVAVARAVDEGDRIVEDALAFVVEAQAAEAARTEAPLRTEGGAGAALPPEAEGVAARLAQIEARQAEIDAKLKGIGR